MTKAYNGINANTFKTLANNLSHSVFSNSFKLDFSYIPKTLIGREKELTQLLYIFNDFKKGFMSNTLITGDIGIGKTTFVKFMQKQIRQELNSVNIKTAYFNCLFSNTLYKIFVNLFEELGYGSGRGRNTDELIHEVFNRLKKKDLKILIILDDAYKLSKEDLNKIGKIKEQFEENENRFSFVLITHTKKHGSLFDITQNCISLPNYSFGEIKLILKNRIENSFTRNVFTDEAFHILSKKVYLHQNLQFGLKVLRHAGHKVDLHDLNMIYKKDLEDMIGKLYNTQKVVRELSIAQNLTLLSLLKQKELSFDLRYKDVYEDYSELCKKYGFNINVYPFFNQLTKQVLFWLVSEKKNSNLHKGLERHFEELKDLKESKKSNKKQKLFNKNEEAIEVIKELNSKEENKDLALVSEA
jgi:Cdc6-like AAA superfamily ATPase